MDTLIGLEDEESFFNSYDPALAEPKATLVPSVPELQDPELELEAPLYTREQLERAGRFRKPVAVVMGVLSTLAVLGLVLQHRPSTQQAMGEVPVAQAPQRLAQAAAAPRSAAVTVSLSPALPAAEPDPAESAATQQAPPSPAADLESTTSSAAFVMMTLAPAHSSARRSAVADARPSRMSNAKPPTAVQAVRQPPTVGAPAIARFPELDR